VLCVLVGATACSSGTQGPAPQEVVIRDDGMVATSVGYEGNAIHTVLAEAADNALILSLDWSSEKPSTAVTLADGSTQSVSMDWTPTLSAQDQLALALAGLRNASGVATSDPDAVDRKVTCSYSTYGGSASGCLIICCTSTGTTTCTYYGDCDYGG
jgi:hypothetical protein